MIIVKKVKPMFTTVITTMDIISEKDMYVSGTQILDINKVKNSVNEFQRVVAIGPHVQGINVGDLVCINPTRFGKPVQKKMNDSIKQNMEEYSTEIRYNFDIIEIDGKPHLKLQDRDIDYVVEEYEDFDENPTIVTEDQLRPKINYEA